MEKAGKGKESTQGTDRLRAAAQKVPADHLFGSANRSIKTIFRNALGAGLVRGGPPSSQFLRAHGSAPFVRI
jgi:hypothetical protein